MKYLLAVLLLGFLPGALVFADDKPGEKEKPKEPKAKAGDIEFGGAGVKIQDAAVARQEIARFKAEFKAAKKNEHKRAELLGRLGKWDHPEILKLARKQISDKSHIVAVAAVRVCVRQTSDKKKTGSVLLRALGKEKRTAVRCALLVGMGYLGFQNKKAKKEAEKFFRRDTTETHKAATRYLGYIKAKDAFRMLAEKLDEPRSKSPNDPNNPPASYWKERWEEWNVNVKWTRWAISQLVEGETFESMDEAKDWAKAEGRKHGIEW